MSKSEIDRIRQALERLRYERFITRSSVKTRQAVILNRLADKGLAVFIDEAWAITPRGATKENQK